MSGLVRSAQLHSEVAGVFMAKAPSRTAQAVPSAAASEHNALSAPSPIELLKQSSKAQQNIAAARTPHQNLKKELFENTQHGTSVFPFASYVWEPQNYTTRVSLHWHREAELVRFAKGKFKIAIDMHEMEIEGDAFLLLPGNVMHTFILPPHCEESAIVFDPKMLMLQGYDELQSEIFEALISSNIPLPPIITPEHQAFNRIDKLYRYCARYGTTSNAAMRLIIKAKLMEILALYHEYGLLTRKDVHSGANRTKQDKLKDLLNYIDSHYAGPMTVKDASMRVGFSDQYFCRYFKHATGMSFTEYLNDLRLRRAAKEIELSSRAISDISYDHGFENAGYFFKSFKKKFGITPMQYRKIHLGLCKDSEVEINEPKPALSATDLDHTLTRGQSVRETVQSYIDAAQAQAPLSSEQVAAIAARDEALEAELAAKNPELRDEPNEEVIEDPAATIKRYSAAYNYQQQHPVKRDASGYPMPQVHEYYEEEYEPDSDLELDENSDFALEQSLSGQLNPPNPCGSVVKIEEPQAENVVPTKNADKAESPAAPQSKSPRTVQQRLEGQGVAPEVAQLADEQGIIDANDVRPIYVHPAQAKLNAMNHLTGSINAWGEEWFDEAEPDLNADSQPIEQELEPYDGVSPDVGPTTHRPVDGTIRPFQASIEQLIKPRQNGKRGFNRKKPS